MKRDILAAILPATFLLLPSALSTQAVAANSQITALGRQDNHHGWLSTDGPDQGGRYTMRIGIADLDPATATGWAQMRSRVHTGTGELCNKVGALPLVGGRYNRAQRECWEETRSQALMQMRQARDAALGGQRVSGLAFKIGPLAR